MHALKTADWPSYSPGKPNALSEPGASAAISPNLARGGAAAARWLRAPSGAPPETKPLWGDLVPLYGDRVLPVLKLLLAAKYAWENYIFIYWGSTG
ncbi:hypothetical protein NDU88_007357 [Pleurodeles waltl]|uniref:Uncharacterized protein n=1 Tax=Pleurodeles waltl TaxID=8319 RepID=A0AAV7QRM1_PLEWA|nr:hypothetical protein NDU88_007357 [Pleurodeles waltl]